jgi:carboxylate-amine ligase
VRVLDQQTTVGDTAALAAVVHSLVAHLAARHDAGDTPAVHPTWRIEANRWSACRHGVEGTLADLDTGEPRPTRQRLRELMSELAPAAVGVGCSAELERAMELVDTGGAQRQRAVAAEGGVRAVSRWLGERFDA